MEVLVFLLILELGVIYILVSRIVCCKMDRRKRKKKDVDVEEGSTVDEHRVKGQVGQGYSLKPKGIPNIGASCFMNSMLQCLFWSPCIENQLQKQIEKMEPKRDRGNLAKTFFNLLKAYRIGDAKVYQKTQTKNVKKFCKELAKQNDRLSGRTQEDSFELYNAIISGLEEETLQNIPFPPDKKDMSEMEHIMQHCNVTRLFGGTFITCYCYKECGHVEPVFQRFTSLSLPPVRKKEKRITGENAESHFAKKRRGPNESAPISVKPKKSRVEDKNESIPMMDVASTPETSPRNPNPVVDENSQLVSSQTQRNKTKKYGSISSNPRKPNVTDSQPDVKTKTSVEPDSLGNTDTRLENDTDVHASNNLLQEVPKRSAKNKNQIRTIESDSTFNDHCTTQAMMCDENDTETSTARTEVCDDNGTVLSTTRSEMGDDNNSEPKTIRAEAGDGNNTESRTTQADEYDGNGTKPKTQRSEIHGGNETDPSTSQSNDANPRISRSQDHGHEFQYKESADDVRRLHLMRLGKRKKKANKRTGLELSLDNWTNHEMMMADDLPCRTCSDKNENYGGVLYKQTYIVSLPLVLVLHINRFEQKGSRLFKVKDFVSYPKHLDMTSYCYKTSEQPDSDNEEMKYSLFGVVNHQGTITGGHYFAYVKTNHRSVQLIQNALQKTWKDPEMMASVIRTKLEAIWQANKRYGTAAEAKANHLQRKHNQYQNMETSDGVDEVKLENCEGHQGPQNSSRPQPSHDKQDCCVPKKARDQENSGDSIGSNDQQDCSEQNGSENEKVARDCKGDRGKLLHDDHQRNIPAQLNKPNDSVPQRSSKISLNKNESNCLDHNTKMTHDYGTIIGCSEEKSNDVLTEGNYSNCKEDMQGKDRNKEIADNVQGKYRNAHDRMENTSDIVPDGDMDNSDLSGDNKDSKHYEKGHDADHTKKHDAFSTDGGVGDDSTNEGERMDIHKKEREADVERGTGETDETKEGSVDINQDTGDIALEAKVEVVNEEEWKNVKRKKKHKGKKQKDRTSQKETTSAEQQDDIFLHEDNGKTTGNEQEVGDFIRPTEDTRDMWFDISDFRVQQIKNETTVLSSSAAYILLYERS